MYFGSVTLLMFVLPVLSVVLEASLAHNPAPVIVLIGKWFVFWGIGVRLFVAGLRQVLQPQFTAKEIFNISSPKVGVIVQELGFANVCMGLLGLWSLLRPEWTLAAALCGGLYYGLAGAKHVFNPGKNALEQFATWTDLAFFAVVLVYFVAKV